MRCLVVAGARPNFMKVAPLLRALRAQGDAFRLVHTGQHYDAAMSDRFFEDLGLPEPDFHLNVGSASHAAQTARVMEAFEPVLLAERPDWVVVVGDVNSTLACALVTAKLKAETGSALAHVEAGLRSNDWRMPEEVNRVLTDRLSDLLLTPSRDAAPNLLAEGISPDRIEFVGNVMIDTLLDQLGRSPREALLRQLGVEREGYAVVTLHRPSNVDDPERLEAMLQALSCLQERMPVVFPVHPRTRRNVESFGLGDRLARTIAVEPMGYSEMVALVEGARVVLTDSGGLQEETTALGVPCVTLREQTERPVTITHGTNRLVQWPPSVSGILETVHAAVADGRFAAGERRPEGWDGRAAERIARALRAHAGRTAQAAGGSAPAAGIAGES